jgi:DNA-directed RNA polymerase III subunit RPC1
MTLKTFHFAGVASMNVTLGVPRIKEIINATKDISTPIIEAKLVNEKDEVSARIVKGRIETTRLGGIASYIKEVYTPKGCYLEVELDLHVIDALKLEVNIQDVVNAIIAAKIKIKDKHIEIRDSKTIHIQPFDLSRENMYFSMQQLKNSLPGVIVKGINSVVRAVISKQQKDEKKFIMFVEGTGLKEVMNTPGIEFRQTKTNHIMEIEKVLGIEAARRTIINEIQYTMKSHGMNIDTRHIQLLADIMTFKGQVFGITRFGVSKMKNSTLMLASFEMTTDHLYESAMHCRKDEIKGVSECIIMGNMIPVGTGMFKLVYDENINKGLISSSDGLQESLVVQENQSGGQDDLAFDQIEEIIKDNTLIVRK